MQIGEIKNRVILPFPANEEEEILPLFASYLQLGWMAYRHSAGAVSE